MIKSIKKRILTYYLIAISITVGILGIFSWHSLREYYYRSISHNMSEQLDVANTFFNKYLKTMPLRKASEEVADTLFINTNIEIQVIDEDKNLVLDSLGISDIDFNNDPYIDRVLKNNENIIIKGKLLSYSDDNVMIIMKPITNKSTNGVIRFITSLEEVDNTLNKIGGFIILIAILIIIVICMISAQISKSIIGPLLKLNDTAKRMAKGEYTVKAEKVYDDEIGNLSDTLNGMCKEILRSEKLKNDFISSISHELKTPLTSIKGWGTTLKIKELQSEQMMEKGLNIIISESDRLTELVNELLDFSRYETGNISLKLEKFNMDTLLQDICMQMKPRTERAGVELIYEYGNLGEITADKNRLKQVFINLVDNSIKFSNNGTVKISSRKIGSLLQIFVEDNGCGIKEEDLSKVKQKFFKSSMDSPGNGIGLALCDEILKLHGGRLNLESEYGKGTKAIVELKS